MKSFTIALLSATLAIAEKVKVELYYESLCPYSEAIITGSFKTAFNTPGFLDMAEILLVPYGNAKEYPNGDSWTYTCQHGINECLYNQIETCSNNYISDPLVAFNFIECIESIETQDTYHKVGP